jgi:DNA-binding response OmpR family regulator
MSFYCSKVGVDLANHVAWLPDGPIGLRPQEARLLRLLSSAPGRLIPTPQILSTLYGGVPDESAKIRLKALVADIRRRLGPLVASRLRAARGLGLILYVDQADAESGTHPIAPVR